jgi:hypothetical protein
MGRPSHRSPTPEEIRLLQAQGCRAEEWGELRVAEPFDPRRLRGVSFSGPVEIGRLQGSVSLPGGVQAPCGLYDSRIHDCRLGDDVLVSQVGLLARYDVEGGAVLQGVEGAVVEGESGFGGSAVLNLLNESGGRGVPICDRLSAQVAYLLVMYRHRPAAVGALEALIAARCAQMRSRRGSVGRGSRVLRCGSLRNVAVGPAAVVEGALELEEGTLASCPEDPCRVGAGVIARRFVMLSGAHVEGAAHLEDCFVGQGVRLGKQFSAEHCAFFANCEGFHGEAVSILAGPYTVSHHKSTLLISCSLSFFNGGSGTNQSNHMYKLGPVHQGIMERGVKTGSFAYLLWPSRVGPFCTVTGKHGGNFDCGDLPFSTISEQEGRSLLTPAVNLINIGARRDEEKWRSRDRRRDPQPLDLIHYALLSPFTVGRIRRGLEVLQALQGRSDPGQEAFPYRGLQIRRLMLKHCQRYYQMALSAYLGERLLERLSPLAEQLPGQARRAELRRLLEPTEAERPGQGEWRDLCGLLAPKAPVEGLLQELEAGKISDLQELQRRLRQLYDGYAAWEWGFCHELLCSRLGRSLEQVEPAGLAALLREGLESAARLQQLLLSDAAREFDAHAHIGFGMDGGEEEAEADFRAVRGTLEDSGFVKRLQERSRELTERAGRLLSRLQGM